jgi:predicted enzyme related to lactoylglutathione lyase
MKAIEVISIPVSSQEKSKEFYLNLGFQVLIEASMGNGQSWVQLGLSNQSTSISLVSWWPYKEVEMRPGSFQGLILETEDIEKEVRQLKTKGIEVSKIPGHKQTSDIDDTPWGKFAHFKDPDGNGFSLHQK